MKIVFWGEGKKLEKGIRLKKTNPDNDSLHADFKLANRRVTAHYYPELKEFVLSFYPRIMTATSVADRLERIIRQGRARKGWETRRIQPFHGPASLRKKEETI